MLDRGCKTPYMKPFVPKGWTRRLLILGEAPGEDEDERSGRPFTGRAGTLLHALLREAGYTVEDVAFVNAVRCRPRRNATPSMRQVRSCRPYVLHVIQRLVPHNIIGCGGTALRCLTNRGDNVNVTKARGRLVSVPGLPDGASGESNSIKTSVWVTYHPSAVLRGATHLRDRILEDLTRKWDLLPWPEEKYPLDGNVVGLDTEYGADETLLTIGLAGSKYAIAYEPGEDRLWTYKSKYILGRKVALAGHSVFGDIQKLTEAGLGLPSEWLNGENVFDSLLLSRMVNENLGSYELENLFLSSFPGEPWKLASKNILAGQKTPDMSAVGTDLRKDRCRKDAWASYKLAMSLAPKIEPKLRVFVHQIAAAVHRMELVGAIVNLNEFEKLSKLVHGYTDSLADLLNRVALQAGMAKFSPTNDNHIRELLYERLGLLVTRRTKKTKRPSVDRITLATLDHEATRQLLEFSKWDKLRSVSTDGLLPLLHPCGVVDNIPVALLEFNFDPLGARTGRRTSKNPNSQNWTPLVRRIIRSRYPGGKILNADYKQLEVRIIAVLAKEWRLLEHFVNGEGYVGVAKDLLGRLIQKGTDDYKVVKQLVLGTDYNMGPYKAAQTLWDKEIRLDILRKKHDKAVYRVHDRYLRMYPNLTGYMEKCERLLLTRGIAKDPLGYVRHLPCPEGRETPGYGHLLNQAINYPVQRTASNITGSALIDVEAAILERKGWSLNTYYGALLETRKNLLTNPPGNGIMVLEYGDLPVIFNEVHDSLVGDIPTPEKEWVELIKEAMLKVSTLRRVYPEFAIPLGVDVQLTNAWGE